MADTWQAYVTHYGTAPKDASQLHQFSKTNANQKELTFTEARSIFNSHREEAVVTNASNTKPPLHLDNKPLPSVSNNNNNNNVNKDETKRQTDECLLEKMNLESIQKDFEQDYKEKIADISNQFKSIYDALQKREMDLKKWRQKEYNEGLTHMNENQRILQQRLNELQSNQCDDETLYKIPKLREFHLHQFTREALQIQKVLNIIFELGSTYQQNTHNTIAIAFKMNTNVANSRQNIKLRMDKHELDFSDSPFGKGRVYSTSNASSKRPPPKKAARNVQQNGTKTLQYTDNQQSAIRGFDIGNNAKYAAAQQMAQNTNALPSNFWESESDTDSDEERKYPQQDIVNRWKTQKTNICNHPSTPQDTQTTNHDTTLTSRRPQRQSVYDNDTSSEEEDAEDGFEKYVPPPSPPKPKPKQTAKEKEEALWKNNTTQWIVHQRNKQHKYDTMWFKLPKMRTGKASGVQMKPYLEESGLSNEQLKQIWRLSDLDKDGKMGNEEFVLCMFLIDEAKNGANVPQTLPKNYIPPSFRGKRLVRTPPKRKALPSNSGQKAAPPALNLNGPKPVPIKRKLPDRKPPELGAQITRKTPTNVNANTNAKQKPKPQYTAPKPKTQLPSKPLIGVKPSPQTQLQGTSSPFGSKKATKSVNADTKKVPAVQSDDTQNGQHSKDKVKAMNTNELNDKVQENEDQNGGTSM